MSPCGLHKPGKPRKNAKEKQIELLKLFRVEEEEKEGIFLTFPCGAKSSITCRNTHACIRTYTERELFCGTQKSFRCIGEPHSETHYILGPVPKPSSRLPFQSMSTRLHQLRCFDGGVAEVNSNVLKAFAHSVHRTSAACSESVCDGDQIAKLWEGNVPPESICVVGMGI